MNQDSYADAIIMAANTVGDSDSIACITGAIMGAKLGISNIPSDWVEKIENKTGLLEVADKLAAKVLETKYDTTAASSLGVEK
jgi:ADP-ribosylglycohydrolase